MFSMDSLRTDNFSWATALSLSLASRLAYEPSGTIEDVTARNWGFHTRTSLEQGDTQGFIAIADDVVLISFRGTDSLGDWLDNIDVVPEARPYGRVHSGFLAAYRRVDAILRAELPNLTGRRCWITGHSLGGALATIAAAELKDVLPVTGIYTYGQPRLADSGVANFFEANFRNRFFRFVNNNDLVTRVPPGYQHVGSLIHFDSNGNIERAATESASESIEPPPLTRQEYQKLQERIRVAKAELRSQQRLETEAVLDVTIEGLFPGLSDHHLDRYIALIQRFASGPSLDATVGIEQSIRSAMESIEATGGPRARKRNSDRVPVLLRLKDPNWIAPQDLQVGSQIGNILSANGSMDVLQRLATDPGVDSIEFSRDSYRKELVTSVPFVGGDKVQRPPISEKGDACLIGIIDEGIDVLHEAFSDAAGQTRILAVWSQLEDSPTRNPNALDAAAFQHTRGTLYLAGDIQQFIANPTTTPAVLRDAGLHGTHVASIAAGRGVGGLADGMAPEARIAVVIPKLRTAPADPWSVGYSTSHFDALTFLKCVASGANVVNPSKAPMAVNVSLGMNAGAHDGSSLLEASFDSITTKGQDPGFVIVKSAGNERGFGGHARFQAFNGLTPIHWQSDAAFRFQDYFELWYQPFDELEFTLIDPAGNLSPTVTRLSPVVSHILGGNTCNMALVERHKDNGDNRLVITIEPQATPIQQGRWTLHVVGTLVRSFARQVDIWVERDDGARAVRFLPEEQNTTLSIPGTADTVITVGACCAVAPLQLRPESSFGLTRTGRPKPDICAPGDNIIAAKASENDHRATIAMSGTSMAAPHATGALALVLSHRHKQPGQLQHNANQLRAAVNLSAKFSGLHNPAVGYGLLDAEALFALLK